MALRSIFKNSVTERVLLEAAKLSGDTLLIIKPNFSDAEAVGQKEWAKFDIYHNTSPIISKGGKGNNRYERRGRIALRYYSEPEEGPNRADEIAEMWTVAFEGWVIPEMSVSFSNVTARETGVVNQGRYEMLLCEATFAYRQTR